MPRPLRPQNLFNNGICLFTHFCIGGILNRMLNKDAIGVGHAEGVGLGCGRRHKPDDAIETAGVP